MMGNDERWRGHAPPLRRKEKASCIKYNIYCFKNNLIRDNIQKLKIIVIRKLTSLLVSFKFQIG